MRDINPQIQTLSSNKPFVKNKDNILNIDMRKRHIIIRGTIIKIKADFWTANIKPEYNGMTF